MTISLVLFSARHCLFPARFRLAYYRTLPYSRRAAPHRFPQSLPLPSPPTPPTVPSALVSFSNRSQPTSFRLSTPRLRSSTDRVSVRRRLSLRRSTGAFLFMTIAWKAVASFPRSAPPSRCSGSRAPEPRLLEREESAESVEPRASSAFVKFRPIAPGELRRSPSFENHPLQRPLRSRRCHKTNTNVAPEDAKLANGRSMVGKEEESARRGAIAFRSAGSHNADRRASEQSFTRPVRRRSRSCASGCACLFACHPPAPAPRERVIDLLDTRYMGYRYGCYRRSS